MLSYIDQANTEINALNEKLRDQDITVQTAKDANEALLDREPELKTELEEAERLLQESQNTLKTLMVFPKHTPQLNLRMIKKKSKPVLNAAKTTSKNI